MRKFLFVVCVLALLGALATAVLAETRSLGELSKKIVFGPAHKSVGLTMDLVNCQWDDAGLHHLQYKFAAFHGHSKLNDVYVVSGGQTLYKRSEHKKLGMDFSFADVTESKAFFDLIDLPTPVKPFNYDSEIWWLFTYYDKVKANGTETEVAKDAVIVWKMKDNSIDWKPLNKQ
jgi:hypothetical protein